MMSSCPAAGQRRERRDPTADDATAEAMPAPRRARIKCPMMWSLRPALHPQRPLHLESTPVRIRPHPHRPTALACRGLHSFPIIPTVCALVWPRRRYCRGGQHRTRAAIQHLAAGPDQGGAAGALQGHVLGQERGSGRVGHQARRRDGREDDRAARKVRSACCKRCVCVRATRVHSCRGCLLPLLMSLGQPGFAPMSPMTHPRCSPCRRTRQRRRSAATASSSRPPWKPSRGPQRRQRPPQAHAGVRRGPRRQRQVNSWRAWAARGVLGGRRYREEFTLRAPSVRLARMRSRWRD